MKLLPMLWILFVSKGYANPALISTLNSELDLLIPADPSPKCPPGYSQPVNSKFDKCYKVYEDYQSRQNASAECKLNNGVLASVHDDTVNSFIFSLAYRVGATSLWLGIQCSKQMDTCINDDETPFDYDNFNAGQPTDTDICVYMSTIGKDKYKWSTFHCKQYFQFACEVSTNAGNTVSSTTVGSTKTTRMPVLKCPMNYNEFQGKCYRIIEYQFMDQDDVIQRCQQVPGGNIASIPSQEVNYFLNTMPTDCPPYWGVIIGLRCPNVAYNGDANSCYWEDGTPFTYNNFVFDEPLAYTNGCPFMLNGTWRNDQNCGWSCGACEAPMSGIPTNTTSTSRKLTTTTARPTRTTTIRTVKNTTNTRNPDLRLRCPPDYNEFQGTCYSIVQNTSMTHDDVIQRCQQIPNGDIVSIPSQEVNDFLNTMPSDCPSIWVVVIGLRCPNVAYNGDTSSCYWEDGTQFIYDNFDSDQPLVTSIYGECAYMSNGKWYNSFDCNAHYSCGACQAPLSDWPTTRSPSNQRYNSDSKTGYYFAPMLILTYFV